MPTYEYNCPTCGGYDLEQRITEQALKNCPTCHGPTQRLISRTAFMLKGGGWYSDGYGSGAAKKETKAESCPGTGGGCGSGACRKPAEA
jgi:putative FmdB family regulatory protein